MIYAHVHLSLSLIEPPSRNQSPRNLSCNSRSRCRCFGTSTALCASLGVSVTSRNMLEHILASALIFVPEKTRSAFPSWLRCMSDGLKTAGKQCSEAGTSFLGGSLVQTHQRDPDYFYAVPPPPPAPAVQPSAAQAWASALT